MKPKNINHFMDNRPKGIIRTKLIVLIDCPNCHSKLKLLEQIKDNGTVKGELLIYKG